MGHTNDPRRPLEGTTVAMGGWAIDNCTECGHVHLMVVVSPSMAQPAAVFGNKGNGIGVRSELIASPDQAEAIAVALIKEANRLRALERRAGAVGADVLAAAKEAG